MKTKLPKLSVRIDLPGEQRFGPGKAALLDAISQDGSISAAARSLSMSYPRALRLIGEMNTQFKAPLVETHQGGVSRGGAELTPLGGELLRLYLKVTASAEASTAADLKAFASKTAPAAQHK